jgi:lipopolysaccharide biosynthesis glycosyltransferase
VALDDLEALWEVDIGNYGIAAIRDNYVNENVPLMFPEITTYFNAGVLYMNLQRWRELSYGEICLQMCQEPKYVGRYEDQDVLNIVFAKEALYLDSRWNITSYDWPNFWSRPHSRPGIAHYAGGLKPWNYSYGHLYAKKYWFYLEKTPWRHERRDEIERGLRTGSIYFNFVKRLRKSGKDFLRYFLRMRFP